MAKFKQITEIPDDGRYYKLGYKTYGVRSDDENWSIKHYDIIIIKYVDGSVTLDGGGYRSEATRDRMNFYLKSKGIFIHEHETIWQIKLANDNSAMFDDGILVGGIDATGYVTFFVFHGCVHDIHVVRKRDQLLKYLSSEIEKYEVLPDKYVYDICRALNYPNINMAVESLDHKDILKAFKKLCFTRLPDVKDIVLK